MFETEQKLAENSGSICRAILECRQRIHDELMVKARRSLKENSEMHTSYYENHKELYAAEQELERMFREIERSYDMLMYRAECYHGSITELCWHTEPMKDL